MESKDLKITSEEAAFAAIKEALETGFGNQSVSLSFENWPNLEIELEGPGYKSAITSPIASAIVDLQTALNRSFALEVHGSNSAAHLTDEEKSAIQFKATVEDGCTLIKVDLGKFAETLATAITAKMTPEMLVVTVLGTVALACGVVAFKAFLNARTRDKQIGQEAETTIAMSREETARHKILAEAMARAPQLKAVDENFNEAKNGLMKAVSDADSLAFNDVTVDQPLARAVVTKGGLRRSMCSSTELILLPTRILGMKMKFGLAYAALKTIKSSPLAFRTIVWMESRSDCFSKPNGEDLQSTSASTQLS